MKSFIAALRSLVLPFGALTGARIVLDGVNGRIEIYNAANNLVGRLDSAGLHIEGAGNQYDISPALGILARNLPDDGQEFRVTPETLFFRPQNPSPLGNTVVHGYIDTGYVTFSAGTIESPALQLSSPELTGTENALLSIRGQKSGSVVDDSAIVAQSGDFRVEAANDIIMLSDVDFRVEAANDVTVQSSQNMTIDAALQIFMNAGTVTVEHELFSGSTGMLYPASQFFTVNIAVAIGNTAVALGSTAYPVAFPPGTQVYGVCNITDGAANSSLWTARFLPVSNTNFNVIVYRNPAAAAAFNLSIDVMAFVVPT